MCEDSGMKMTMIRREKNNRIGTDLDHPPAIPLRKKKKKKQIKGRNLSPLSFPFFLSIVSFFHSFIFDTERKKSMGEKAEGRERREVWL
jgi:hypothetical protein